MYSLFKWRVGDKALEWRVKEFCQIMGETKEWWRLIEVGGGKGFLSKDLIKFVTEALVSLSPDNRYPMQA